MRRLVEVTTLFDAKGRPLTSYEAMEARIKLLEHQRDRLIRAMRGQSLRNGPVVDEPKPIIH